MTDTDAYVLEVWRPGGRWHTLAIGPRRTATEACEKAAEHSPHATFRVRRFDGSDVIMTAGPRLADDEPGPG